MNRWLLIFAALATLASAADSGKKIVCYFANWIGYRPPEWRFNISDIQPNLCTHLIYGFVGIDTEGDVRIFDPLQDLPDNSGKDGFGKFNKLREQSPKTKTLVAIGGKTEGSVKFSAVVNSWWTVRPRFVQNVVQFVKKYNFDGFDIDWQYPNQYGENPKDVKNYINLLKELKTEFDKHGLILSVTVAAAEDSASQFYDIDAMCKYVDFINLMTFDFHNDWQNVTAHNAPLYSRKGESENDLKLNVDASVHYWLKNGCPPEKLILGVPFYGRSFTLADKNYNGLGAPVIGPGTVSSTLEYNEICESFEKGGWTVVREKEHRTPYAYKDDQWIGYDDITSLTEKTAYINSLHLGGAMVWSIDNDDYSGKCGEKYPLLKTLNVGLREQIPMEPLNSTKNPSQTTPLPNTTLSPEKTPLPETAPPKDICKKNGYVRDKQYCDIFYMCQNINGAFQIHKFSCPNGLIFDPQINVCNYKSLIECN